MTKFKDVAHLYLGCNVQVKRKNDTPNNYNIGELVEVTKGSNHGDWIIAKFNTVVEAVSNTWAVSHASAHYYFLCEDEIKPILRKLEDITKEELKELWKIVFNREFGENGCISVFGQTKIYPKRYVMHSGVEMLGFHFNGRVWGYSDLVIWQNYNQHEVTLYLLSHHFDLFQLIETNQAIDAKTLTDKPTQNGN